MKLLVAKNSGFCFGVRRAVDICHREAALKDCVYSWGKIIHNELVVEELEREGVHPVESLEQVPAGATLIIRAHGAVPELFGLCRERGIETVDATCPFVNGSIIWSAGPERRGSPYTLREKNTIRRSSV